MAESPAPSANTKSGAAKKKKEDRRETKGASSSLREERCRQRQEGNATPVVPWMNSSEIEEFLREGYNLLTLGNK